MNVHDCTGQNATSDVRRASTTRRPSAAMDAASVAKMTVPQLREALEARGLDTKGLKAALVARLVEALDGPGDAQQVRCALRCAAAPAACVSSAVRG